MPSREYRVVVYRAEEGGFWGEVEGLPGCVAQAGTLEELRDAAIGAIEAWVETRREMDAERGTDGEPLPRRFLTMDIPAEDLRLEIA